jgi:hypothetical protein
LAPAISAIKAAGSEVPFEEVVPETQGMDLNLCPWQLNERRLSFLRPTAITWIPSGIAN